MEVRLKALGCGMWEQIVHWKKQDIEEAVPADRSVC
jgi:hypothetical protein